MIKSPLNYVGGKGKLLPSLLSLFPLKINTFIDLFCGGGNVGINVNAKNIVMNDKQKVVIDLYKYLQENDPYLVLQHADKVIKEFNLSVYNKKEYFIFRDYYNNVNPSPLHFFVLISYSFNNLFEFSKKENKMNMPAGHKRSYLTNNMKKNLISFSKALKKKKIKLCHLDYKDVDIRGADFIYLDPPYYASNNNYSAMWSKAEEISLLNYLSNLNKQGIRFGLSNVLTNKGKENTLLKDFIESERMPYLYLNKDYTHSIRGGIRHKKDTKEIYIYNYQIPELPLFS